MWKIHYQQQPVKFLKKLDNPTKEKILDYLEKILTAKNPKIFGKALSANLTGLWRYRVGDYRIICDIRQKELIILVIDIGHRKNIYR